MWLRETAMTDITHITYLFDPLCGWCYGASATLEKLVARPDLDIRLAPTGLFAGTGARPMDDGFAAYAWTNDQRISRLTGQPFSEDYLRKVLDDRTRLFDSCLPTLALTAVALNAPHREFEALKAIQNARYVEGRDITDLAVLVRILRGLELNDAADQLANLDPRVIAAYQTRLDAARQEMRRFSASGVPALVVGTDDNRRIVQASALFGSMDMLIAGLKAA